MIEHTYQGFKFYFHETPTAPALINEIFSDNYKVLEKGLVFHDRDVILDIGANEGMFSIMMARLFPHTRVIALEPVPRTFYQMIRNIGLNGMNITALNIGVGAERGIQNLIVSKQFSGGSTGFCTFDPETQIKAEVDIYKLDDVFSMIGVDRVRLMKMDIEGGEHETLYPCTVLGRVDCMVGKFHINRRLAEQGYSIDGLAKWVSERTELVHYESCYMAE
ncbi:MAG: FkbM family methyltransferase [Methanoregula sp.]|jgi:FkbM family methyltransferase